MSPPPTYCVLLSGTHVTGKDTLAPALSTSLSCPWLNAEMCHNSATFGARSQAKKGYDYGSVFGRIWMTKLSRLGFVPPTDSTATIQHCTALLSCYHMRKPARDAIRAVMLAHGVRAIFVIMQITPETLSGRTLGAEEPELAGRIMKGKMADIEEPVEGEGDVVVIDSMVEVDAMLPEIERRLDLLLRGRGSELIAQQDLV